MLNFAVAGGTSGHLLGAALATILLGPWAAIVALTCVISVQALIFQDGGLLALGANIFNMGIIGVAVSFMAYRTIQRLAGGQRWGIFVGGFAAAWLSVFEASLAAALRVVAGIFAAPAFLRHAAASVFFVGGFMALQSLWVVPWVMNVNGFDIAGAATVLVALNLGNLAGQLAVGVFGVRLARAGVQPLGLLRAGYGMMLVVQALILWSDLPVLPLWTAFGLLTAANSQIYLSAARAFPPALFGRVSTALNLMAFAGAFCVQWGFGIGLDLMRGMGVELARALAWGFGALLALQALAYLPLLGRPAARPSKGEA